MGLGCGWDCIYLGWEELIRTHPPLHARKDLQHTGFENTTTHGVNALSVPQPILGLELPFCLLLAQPFGHAFARLERVALSFAYSFLSWG